MDKSKIAHLLDEKPRTSDIKLKQSSFAKMSLSNSIKKGLEQAGYLYPTVLQANAIPIGIAGIDLLIQSKSGTGKTLIYCTILLELLKSTPESQSLILVPTREIAVQIKDILNKLGKYSPGLNAVSVIGGLEVNDDRKNLQGARIIVGTPGRVLHLIQNKILNTAQITYLIIDEADKLMGQSFRQDFEKIYLSLPIKKQVIACSATFYKDLDVRLAQYMKNPLLLSTEKRATLLVGIKQFYYDLPEEKINIVEMQSKLFALKNIFGKIAFKQCLVFVSSQSRANSYRNLLEKDGWPCEFLTGAQDQKTRLDMFRKFQDFKTRILISTDLMSRGIDSENVNLVINLEIPNDAPTYLHRIGRAGRFGTHGIAITFLSSKNDHKNFAELLKTIGSDMNVLKFPINSNVPDIWNFSNLEIDAQNFGTFNSENDFNIEHKQNYNEDKENLHGKKKCINDIDTKTYKIDFEKNINQNKILLTETMSSMQILPSSNTIDDASSIAVDSEILQSQISAENGEKIVLSTSLIDVLIDDSKNLSEDKLDLFEDYKNTVQENKNKPQLKIKPKLIEPPRNYNLTDSIETNLNQQLTKSENIKDFFFEYEKLTANQGNNSNNTTETVGCCSTSKILPKSSDLLNVDCSELSLANQDVLQKPHFPSPKENHEFLVRSNSQQSIDSDNLEVQSLATEYSESVNSSGFDEKTTSEKSSGIVSSSDIDQVSNTDESSNEYNCVYTISSDNYNGSEDSSSNYDESNEEYETYLSSIEKNCSISSSDISSLYHENNNQNEIYQNAYARWTELYWNQMTYIQDYVKFSTYVKRNPN